MKPGSSSAEIIQGIHPGRLAYVDPGLTTLQFEFIGPATGLRARLGADFERIFVQPPWGQ